MENSFDIEWLQPTSSETCYIQDDHHLITQASNNNDNVALNNVVEENDTWISEIFESFSFGDDSSMSWNRDRPQAQSVSFPLKLYRMLQDAKDEGFEDVVSWHPDGRGFKVHNPTKFIKSISPMYFNQSKYRSFLKQLNLYGFKRIARGGERGTYHHKHLVRGKPDLLHCITRFKSPTHQPSRYLPRFSGPKVADTTEACNRCSCRCSLQDASTFPRNEESSLECFNFWNDTMPTWNASTITPRGRNDEDRELEPNSIATVNDIRSSPALIEDIIGIFGSAT